MSAARRIPADPRHEIWTLIRGRCAIDLGVRVFQRERDPYARSGRPPPADLRLPAARNGVQALEIDSVGLGFRIRERRPRLSEDEPLPLSVRMTQTQRVPASG